MANVRVRDHVEHIGVRQFIAIASGVPEEPQNVAIVLTAISPSLVEANQHKGRRMVEVGEKVQARGDRVVDVEGV